MKLTQEMLGMQPSKRVEPEEATLPSDVLDLLRSREEWVEEELARLDPATTFHEHESMRRSRRHSRQPRNNTRTALRRKWVYLQMPPRILPAEQSL